MTDTDTIRDLEDQRQTLLLRQIDLDEAKSRVLKLARLYPTYGGITVEETNLRTAKIAADRKLVDSALADIETRLAELTRVLPVTLTVSDLTDIVSLFEYTFSGKTPPAAVAAMLVRLKNLTKGSTSS
jgi:hypothetical protein